MACACLSALLLPLLLGAALRCSADNAPRFSMSSFDAAVVKDLPPTDPSVLAQDGSDPLAQCYAQVVRGLQLQCGELFGEQLSKVALQLYNCVALSEGRPTYECPPESTIRECTQPMDTTTWGTYQHVSGRALLLCHRTQVELWRRQAEATVAMLDKSVRDNVQLIANISKGHQQLLASTNSVAAAVEGMHTAVSAQQEELRRQVAAAADGLGSALRQSLDVGELVLARQNESLASLAALLNAASATAEGLTAARASLGSLQEEMSQRHKELQTIMGDIFDGFDRIASFKAMLLSQVFDMQSVAFYVTAVALSYLLTTADALRRARLQLFLLLSLNVLLERMIVHTVIVDDVSAWLWTLRKASVALAGTLLVHCSLTYVDPVSAASLSVQRLERGLASLVAAQHALEQGVHESIAAAQQVLASIEAAETLPPVDDLDDDDVDFAALLPTDDNIGTGSDSGSEESWATDISDSEVGDLVDGGPTEGVLASKRGIALDEAGGGAYALRPRRAHPLTLLARLETPSQFAAAVEYVQDAHRARGQHATEVL